MRGHYEWSEMENTWLAKPSDLGKRLRVKITYQIPHHLTCNISPSDENASRTHRTPLFLPTMISTAASHESLAALVSPAHNLTHGLAAFGKSLENGDKFDLE